jgi:hypothetical protein
VRLVSDRLLCERMAWLQVGGWLKH